MLATNKGSAAIALIIAALVGVVFLAGQQIQGNEFFKVTGAQTAFTGFATKSECTGTPTADCDLTEQNACTNIGCSWGDSCSGGQVSSCNSFNLQADCTAQKGCSWSNLNNACIGIAMACNSNFLNNQQDCIKQKTAAGGTCTWGGTCSGNPSACSTFGQDTCTAQTGCLWSQTCTDVDGDGYGAKGTDQRGCVDSEGNQIKEDDCDDSNPDKTTDCAPPVISNLAVSEVEKTSATAQWQTSESATGVLDYGTSASSLNLQTSNSDLYTRHSLVLASLAKNTTYFYKATSCDAANNCNSSMVLNFTTKAPDACAGQVLLAINGLVDGALTRNTQASATVSGLTDGCKGRLAILKNESCTGAEVSSAAITEGIDNGNASISFTVPNTPTLQGTPGYKYVACVDISGDSKFMSTGEASAQASFDVVACIRNNPEVSVSPDAQDVGIGQIGKYTITVTNKNTCASTFVVNSTCLPGGQEGWDCAFSPQDLSIAAGAKGTSTLEIQTPEKAAAGFDAVFDIVVEDKAETQYEASATVHNIVTICTASSPELTISPRNQTKMAGGIADFTATIKNSGNCAVTYSVAVGCPEGWVCETGKKSVEVQPTSESSVAISATSVADAQKGDYDIKVSITNKKDETLSAEASAKYGVQTCTDADADEFFAEGGICGQKDCDDGDAEVNPDVITETANGKDDNCDGKLSVEEEDADSDGVATYQGDCDDLNAGVNPSAAEVCTDKIDNNCNPDDDTACEVKDQSIIGTVLDTTQEESEDTTIAESMLSGEKPVAGEAVQAEVEAEGSSRLSLFLLILIIVVVAAAGLAYQFYIKPKRQLGSMAEMQGIGPGSSPNDVQNFMAGGLAEGMPEGQMQSVLAEQGVPQARIEKGLQMTADSLNELDDLAKKRNIHETKEFEGGEKYVSDCISKGYSPVQIKAALVEAGWPDNLIENLIGGEVTSDLERLAKKLGADKPSGKTGALQKFIKEALKSGHTQESVRKVLEEAGWEESKIIF